MAAAAATMNAVKTAVKNTKSSSHILGKELMMFGKEKAATPKIPEMAPLIPKEPVVQCHWWNGVYDSVLDPKSFLIDGGGKLKEDDLDSASLIGQELREKFDATGLVHVQNTVSVLMYTVVCVMFFFPIIHPTHPPHPPTHPL